MDCMRDGFENGKILDGRFLTVAPLNHGSFGMVFTAKDTLTGADVAIKCITKADAVNDHTNCPTIHTDERSEELSIHSRLDAHPNIVNLVCHFETQAHQYMVLELCSNGDLYEAIKVGRGPLETEHVRAFMLELVDAIEHLHINGVYHRDIKPENIFLTTSGAGKLGDFGLATTETWSTEFAVGSDRYMAPEQYDASVYGYGYSPASADVWAIGIVLLNVLFQRNPFAVPTMKDPLFADFASDRQSLFDVFPTMSQDTFSVLLHSLALDPANRSLSAVREALKAVVTFTTDDEILDDFCTEQNDVVPVSTGAREPLRTPSITSPNMANADSFPWTANLLRSPQKPIRQLSTIRDEEHDLFPGSIQNEWQYVDTDEASLSSNVDSGLGMSYKSSKSAKSTHSTSSFIPKSFNMVGSLPISFTRPANKVSPYGGHGHGFSKSWSDLWDEEEEEEQQRSSFDLGMEIDRVDTAKPSTPQLRTIGEEDRGSVTPRPVLAETDVNTRHSSSKLVELDKAITELPKTRSSSILDKWAALGNFRRAKQDLRQDIKQDTKQDISSANATPTPQKTKYADAFSSFTSFGSSKKQKTQVKTARSPSWRQDSPPNLAFAQANKSQVWERKEGSPTHGPQSWELDNNWREHKPPMSKVPSPTSAKSRTFSTHSHERRKEAKRSFESDFSMGDPDGDLEWILGPSGSHDFHT